MKQTLTQRVEALEKRLDDKCKGWHIFTMGASKCDRCGIENPSYTAMRSTGEYCTCVHIGEPNSNKCVTCYKPIKPQEDVREKIYEELVPYMTQGAAFGLSERILAIVKGE